MGGLHVGNTTTQGGHTDTTTPNGTTANVRGYVARSADAAHSFTNTSYFPGSGQEWSWVCKLNASCGSAGATGAVALGYDMGLWVDGLVHNVPDLDSATSTSATSALIFRGGAYSGTGDDAAGFASRHNLVS